MRSVQQDVARQCTGMIDLTTGRVRKGPPETEAGTRTTGSRKYLRRFAIEHVGCLGGLAEVVKRPSVRQRYRIRSVGRAEYGT